MASSANIAAKFWATTIWTRKVRPLLSASGNQRNGILRCRCRSTSKMTQTGTKPACVCVLLIEDEPTVLALVRAVLEATDMPSLPANPAPKPCACSRLTTFMASSPTCARRRRRWRPGLCLDRPPPAGIGPPPGIYHRRHCQRGNRGHAAPHRRALREKPFRVHDFISVVEQTMGRAAS